MGVGGELLRALSLRARGAKPSRSKLAFDGGDLARESPTPALQARAAARANASTSGRVIWYCRARFSAVSPMVALAAGSSSASHRKSLKSTAPMRKPRMV